MKCFFLNSKRCAEVTYLTFLLVTNNSTKNRSKSSKSNKSSKSKSEPKVKKSKVRNGQSEQNEQQNNPELMQIIEEEEPEPAVSSVQQTSRRANRIMSEPESDVEEPVPVRNTEKDNTETVQFKVPPILKQKRARGEKRDHASVKEVVRHGDDISHDSGLQSVSETSVRIKRMRT